MQRSACAWTPKVFLGGVVAALLLSGCSSWKKTTDGWFGKSPSEAQQASTPARSATYYARTEGLKVFSEPSASSKVLGTLSLHEKVTRTKVDRGFAYVESTTSGVKGWADNAQLLWRLPAAAAGGSSRSAAPPPSPEPPKGEASGETAEPAPQPGTATEAPATEPTTTTLPPAPSDSGGGSGGVSPSILDSY